METPGLFATACPYCGEPVQLVADASAGAQAYVEDCPVRCRPMEVSLSVDADGDAVLSLRRDDEA